MPGSTGPDNNTYTIPEVQLGDTFNFWRDATNTAIYKLNKLKIYDAVGSGSIGVTYGSTGVWNAFLAPTITEGLTFTQTIVFSTGITTAGVYSSKGITAIAGIWTTGGLSADRLYVGGGSTFASIVAFVGGLSASNIYASGGSTFASIVTFVGGLSASNIYASGGSTFAGILQVNGGATFASTTDYSGAARFNNGVTASTIDVTGAARFNGGATASVLDVNGVARFNGGLSAARIYVSGGSTFASIVAFVDGLSASNIYGSGGSTFASIVAFVGGLSASNIYGSGGSTFAGILQVNGGATFASTTDHSGAARFTGGATASTIDVTGAARFNGGATASTIDVTGAARFTGGATASTIDVTGAARFTGGATASTLQVTGNATVGNNGTGATLGVCGSVSLLARTPLRFADADSTHYVAFQAPATVTNSLTWTLPSTDGSNGQVLSTNGSNTLSWKEADGVTGSNKQVQYNQSGAPGATAGFVFEYATATGVCAGTLGLSGGLYCNNNVAIGLTQGAVSARIYGTNSTAKLEVRGDIRIPSNGFFVTKGMTLPAATETIIGADENAFIAGRLSIPSGATLTIQTDGSLVIL
jgi:cytoskeletal protein CcmA (bactofilin family)